MLCVVSVLNSDLRLFSMRNFLNEIYFKTLLKQNIDENKGKSNYLCYVKSLKFSRLFNCMFLVSYDAEK